MKYILLCKSGYFIISAQEKEQFKKIYNETAGNLLPWQNQVIDRFGIEILELPFYLKNENQKLRIRGLCRCRYCGIIKNLMDKCQCADKPQLRENNEFSLKETHNNLLTSQNNEQQSKKIVIS